MQALIEYLAKEGRVILQAPATFGIAIAICLGLIWTAFGWAYSARFEGQASQLGGLEQRVKFRDDLIADYKSKLSGATPDEAKARLDTLERQVSALAPRRLSTDQRQKVKRALIGVRGTISIAHDMAAGEAKQLVVEFIVLFQEENWTVLQSSVMGLGMHPRSGIALVVVNPAALSAFELRLKRALEDAGIDFDVHPGLRRSPPGFPPVSKEPEPDVGLVLTSRVS